MFVGRKKELKALRSRLVSRSASFVALRGRRRIGKSRLIQEFAKDFPVKYLFTGLPPAKGVSRQDQRDEFTQQMVAQGIPEAKGGDWSELFFLLSKFTNQGRVLIALDEVAWMGSKDPTFLGKLKTAWDQYFEKNSELVLIVASSISSWIDKNILSSTGFFGRVDLTLTLKELSLKHCSAFWEGEENRVSAYEKLKILGLTGGVPKYLDAINPKLCAEENIQALCFLESGLLFNEFDKIFHDLFSRRGQTYKHIIELLASAHSLTQLEICKGLKKQNGRVISDYLNDLVTAGFLSADFSWSIRSAVISKLRKFRLSDNYLRFYLKYIEPNKQKIKRENFDKTSVFSAFNWSSVMGLQFENLVIHNYQELYRFLGIQSSDVVLEGPFFQTKTRHRSGCQIDYMIQDKTCSLYLCEIKFSVRTISIDIVEEMKKKAAALERPRHFSYRPVLIHVGEVSREVQASGYFYRIIDWTKLLDKAQLIEEV